MPETIATATGESVPGELARHGPARQPPTTCGCAASGKGPGREGEEASPKPTLGSRALGANNRIQHTWLAVAGFAYRSKCSRSGYTEVKATRSLHQPNCCFFTFLKCGCLKNIKVNHVVYVLFLFTQHQADNQLCTSGSSIGATIEDGGGHLHGNRCNFQTKGLEGNPGREPWGLRLRAKSSIVSHDKMESSPSYTPA